MIRMDWNESVHKPGMDYPIYTQLRTTAREKTQHGKCHGGEMPSSVFEMSQSDYSKFLSTCSTVPYTYNKIKRPCNAADYVDELLRKYYAGFSYRSKTWFNAYNYWGSRHAYFKLNKEDFEAEITA